MDEEEQIAETMETNPMQMYEPSERDPSDNKENMVLRSLVGDPNRHTPSGEHTSPSMISSEGKPLSSMYTLETRYQPIPARVLPKKTEKTKIYYMESKPIEESPNEEIPSPIQSVSSTSFLEPKVLSQPILYSVPGAKPKRPILIHEEPSTPTVYAITGRPRRPTIDLSVNDSEIIDQSPALYALVGTPRVQNQIPEPSKQYLQPTANLYSLVGSPRAQDQIPESPKPFPNLYSVVGSPARTSRGVQVSPLGPARPAPTVYTTVNDTSAPINKPKENRLPPNKKQPTDEPVYNSDNEGKVRYEQQLVQKPTIYALIDQPNPSVQENRTKLPARKKTPPPTTTVISRRNSHSIERKPEVINDEIISYPTTKPKRQTQSKKPTVPTPELILIPLDEEQRHPRPQAALQPPASFYTNPEQTPRKPHTVTQYDPIQLPDYRSPYAYGTHKPYRERKYNNDPLPVISHNHSERKPRPPLYEPRYRVERHHPYGTANPTSLERYPVNTKPRSDLWNNNGYQTQTDDDEEYEQRMNRKKRIYHTKRPRAPWIPVW